MLYLTAIRRRGINNNKGNLKKIRNYDGSLIILRISLIQQSKGKSILRNIFFVDKLCFEFAGLKRWEGRQSGVLESQHTEREGAGKRKWDIAL